MWTPRRPSVVGPTAYFRVEVTTTPTWPIIAYHSHLQQQDRHVLDLVERYGRFVTELLFIEKQRLPSYADAFHDRDLPLDGIHGIAAVTVDV
jgi:hypothetical protein